MCVYMASAARKRARTGGGGEDGDAPVPVADGFEAPIFGARVVGQVTTLTLEGEDGPLASLGPVGVASDHAGAWYVSTKDSLLHVSAAGRVRRVAALPASGVFYTVAASPNGSALFVADFTRNKIRRVEVATGAVTTLAGSGQVGGADGVGDAAEFCSPLGLAISPNGSALFVADFHNHKIRRVEFATGEVTTIAGSGDEGDADGVGDAAEFYFPHGISISPDGSALFVADSSNHKIRRVEVATGAVTTLAGSGEEGGADGVGDAAQFYNPSGVAISPDGGALFVANYGNDKIRRVEVATGEVTTLAGSGTSGSVDGVGDAAELNGPVEVDISPDGSTLLVASDGGLRQVCVAAPPPPPSFAPIVVPPSTILADLAKTRGDATLPQGMVTFLVGDDEERIEHVSKNNLCARSPVFRTMFGIGMKERDAAEVTVAHTGLASFTALVDYLLSDQFDLGEEEGRAQRALDLRELAQMYQVPRLELLCAQALQESVAPATAVPLLEAARTMGDGRLLAQCRRFVADHAAEVRASGGVEQLRDFGVAKGLLGDALDQVAELKGAMHALRVAES
ncbi:hypothetical protein EMIHUDRAFT_434364 [Emiliania huxleyi CCMP1516]|uniref:BTB domain-containing protein n=2 Tax=Emiliania huxleyi TaxID=2903 RepID=A0A0D3K5M4_EMIH1|nr:hypothetical protein EMIHUDRAFT_434364 [Emiliania huxleyi CCMP1516]EOD31059.1 hypothetical protein EMIHUDRAFT_434364 [Emiliania huxleyi CCMP1516]|eukprot:XP_005783488.1 hypothetical protein EMIHUDRAFT_434364 [Emiliania huxleyi CCMP1516]